LNREEAIMELTGKVAIVTGSSRGIGRAYARALAGEGATVVVTARTVTEPVVVAGGTAPSELQVKGGLAGSVETTASQIRDADGTAIAL
jgi:NAD(P)-dependent dehydrogenase (short-subunit alcohol dehydrogenase family)